MKKKIEKVSQETLLLGYPVAERQDVEDLPEFPITFGDFRHYVVFKLKEKDAQEKEQED